MYNNYNYELLSRMKFWTSYSARKSKMTSCILISCVTLFTVLNADTKNRCIMILDMKFCQNDLRKRSK